MFSVPTVGHSESTAECTPDCRMGYPFQNRKCISRCNPACASGSACPDAGECSTMNPLPETASAGGPYFAIMGGFVMASEIHSDPPDGCLDTETGLILPATADSMITRNFSVGGYVNYIGSEVSYVSFASDRSIIAVGVTMKRAFELNPQMQFSAGLGLGHQMTDATDAGESGEDSIGFDLAAITELVFKGETGLTYVISLACVFQPGGVMTLRISAGPPSSFSMVVSNSETKPRSTKTRTGGINVPLTRHAHGISVGNLFQIFILSADESNPIYYCSYLPIDGYWLSFRRWSNITSNRKPIRPVVNGCGIG